MSDETTTPPEAPPAVTPPRRRPLALIALGAMALGVAGGGAAAVALTGDSAPERLAVAAAAGDEDSGPADAGDEAAAPATDAPGACGDGHDLRRPGAHGTVTAIDGSTVTLEDDEATPTTVTTDDDTTVLDVSEGDGADIAEGDAVVVVGETGEDDVVTARRVVALGPLDPDVLLPGGAERPGPPAGTEGTDRPGHVRFAPVTGTVASVDGDTVTVTTDEGDVVVTTTDDTAVTVVREIAVSDLAEGDTVAARGEVDDEGTVAADVIIRGDLGAGRPGFGFGPGSAPGAGGGRPGGPGGWGPRGEGERPGPPEDAPEAPDAEDEDGTTTTTEA